MAADITGFAVLGLRAVIESAFTICNTAERLHVCRSECQYLGNRCVNLLLTLRDSSDGITGSRANELRGEVEATIERIRFRVTQWETWGLLRTCYQLSTITADIITFHREIDTCAQRFSVHVMMELARLQSDFQRMQERADDATVEIREILRQVVMIQNYILNELRQNGFQVTQEENIRTSVSSLNIMTPESLPPDLSGQVTFVSNTPIKDGKHSVVFKGMYMNELVALRCSSDSDPSRLDNEVSIRPMLDHRNITPLRGTVSIDDTIYTVTRWMENGDAFTYVRENPTVDRLKLFMEVASGLEHLHSRGIVRRDLRSAHILIDKDGVAHLNNFGLSKLLSGYERDAAIQADLRDFSKVCRELIAGAHHIDPGRLPDGPDAMATSRGLYDELLDLLQRFLAEESGVPLSMSTIKSKIEQLRQRLLQDPQTDLPDLGSLEPLRPISPPSLLLPVLVGRRSTVSSGESQEGLFSPLSGPPSGQESPITSPEPTTPISTGTCLSPLEPPENQFPLRGIIGETPNVPPPSQSSEGNSATTRLTSQDQFSPLVENSDGSVRSATVEGLMRRLINRPICPSTIQNPDSSPRVECIKETANYREIFFLTYFGFTTTETVLEFLVQKFHEASHPPEGSVSGTYESLAELRTEIRVNIIKAIEHWVTTPHVQIDRDVLVQIRDFLLGVKSSKPMKELAERVVAKITFSDVPPLLPPRQGVPQVTSLNMSADSLAKALTILEGEMYNRLLPADYIRYLLYSTTSGNMADALATNERITYWVQESTLTSSEKERPATFALFVNTAARCHELNNFASLAAIITALRSQLIAPLTTLRDKAEFVYPGLLKSLSCLEKVITGGPRFELYKEALKKSGHSSIPFLGAHLIDLKAAIEGTSPIREDNVRRAGQVGGADGSATHINFAWYVKVHSPLKELVQYKAPLVEHDQSVKSLLAHLDDRLRTKPTNAILIVEQRNLIKYAQIAKKEHETAKKRRDVELEGLGLGY